MSIAKICVILAIGGRRIGQRCISNREHHPDQICLTICCMPGKETSDETSVSVDCCCCRVVIGPGRSRSARDHKLGLFCINRDSWSVARDPLGEVGEEALVVKLGLFCIFNRDSSLVTRGP